MVATVSCKINIDNSGLKELEKALQYLKNNVVHSGVINADPETTLIAAKNEFGGHSVYTYGPYKGETVEVPERSFIRKSLNRMNKQIIEYGCLPFYNEMTERSAREALENVGEMASNAQMTAIETNGSNVDGWQTWQDYRTIITKGHNKPLFTRNFETFPIDYKVVRKAA